MDPLDRAWDHLVSDPNFKRLFAESPVADRVESRRRLILEGRENEEIRWKARGFLEAVDYLRSLPEVQMKIRQSQRQAEQRYEDPRRSSWMAMLTGGDGAWSSTPPPATDEESTPQ